MSGRSVQLQLLCIIVVLGAGVLISPTDESYPSDDLTVTVEGTIVAHDGTAVSTGRIIALPIRSGPLPTGNISTAVTEDGRYSIQLLSGQPYTLVFTEYNQSTRLIDSRAELVRNGIPDIYTIENIRPQTDMTRETTRLPQAYPVRIRLADRVGAPDLAATVAVYHVAGDDTSAGFTNVSVDDGRFARFTATDARTIDLVGRIVISVNTSTREERLERQYTINRSREISINATPKGSD